MNAIYKKGQVRKTDKQFKKHFTQFSEKEVQYLKSKVKKLKNNVYFSKHELNNGNDTTLQQIKNNINNDMNIIEYNVTYYDEDKVDIRVVVRGNEIYSVNFKKSNGHIINKEANLCFVISIISGKIITTYYNKVKDNHETIDLRRYCEFLKII